MASLSITLLGVYAVRVDDAAIDDLGYDRMRALLAILALTPGRLHRREHLAGLLWPDVAESDARRNLRVVLHRLRTVIRDREVDPPFLSATRDELQLNPDADISVDVGTFRELLSEVERHRHASVDRCPTCLEKLARAVAMYQGDLLPGLDLDSPEFEEWLLVERESLHRQALSALDQLTEAFLVERAYDQALAYARQQIALEPWEERAHRQAMRALALRGQRAAAIAQYERCARTLQAEMGIAPEASTMALHRQILAGELVPDPEVVRRTPLLTSQAAPSAVSGDGIVDGPYVLEPRSAADGGATVGQVPAEERRTVSLVIADLAEGDHMAAAAGPEAWAEISRATLGRLQAAIDGYGGLVLRQHPDGIVAAFGAGPVYEDDAERAVMAALAMAEVVDTGVDALPMPDGALVATEHDSDAGGGRAILTVGVTTGLAVVAPAAVGGVTVHSGGLGELAALQPQVPAGTVWVTDAVYRRVPALFDWAWLGEARVGPGRPTRLYRPLRPLPTSAEREVGGYRVPLIGRAAELATLVEAVERLKAGIGGIVTVVGEAGLGKSRLIAEAREADAASGSQDSMMESGGAGPLAPAVVAPQARWVVGRWLSYRQGAAFSGWQGLLRRLLDLGSDCDRTSCERLQDRVAVICPDKMSQIVPYLTRLLALPEDEAVTSKLDSLVEAGLLRGAIHHAVLALTRCVAAETPLVLVLEDLHWAEDSSLVLLSHLLPLTEQVPLLIITSLRPARDHGVWRVRELVSRAYAHRHADLWLAPLSTEDCRRLVTQLLGTAQDASDGRIEEILSRAEGNPFFAAEIVRSLSDETILVDALPVTVQGVLMARMNRLPGLARNVLQLASVIGRVFDYDVLADLVVGSAETDQPRLDRALLELVRGQMIRETRSSVDDGSGRRGAQVRSFMFEHELTREAAYGSLLQRKRRVLHRRVAEALERLHPERVPAQLGALAYHWERAGVVTRAIDYLERAGSQAAAQYANAEAVEYLTRALRLLPASDHATRFALLLSRERLHHRRGDREAQDQDITALKSLAEASASPRWQALAAVRSAGRYDATGRADLALNEAERAVRMAREAGDGLIEAEGLLYLGQSVSTSERLDAGLMHLASALTRARSVGAERLVGRILREYGLRLAWVADLAGADAVLREALAVGRANGDLLGEAKALDAQALRSLYAGDYAQALQLTDQGIALHRQVGDRFDEGYSLATASWALLLTGKYGAALEAAAASLALLRDVGSPPGVAYTMLTQSTVFTDLGRYEEALAGFSEAAGLAPQAGDFFPLQKSWAGLARAHLLMGDPKAAQAYGEKLVAHMAAHQAAWAWYPYLYVWAEVVMGDAKMAADDPDGAYHLYRNAHKRVADPQVAVIIRPNLALDVRARLAAAAAARGDRDGVREHLTPILAPLLAGDVDGALDPIRIYLLAHQILESDGDARAAALLSTGQRVLMVRADAIGDEGLRRSYLEDVTANREILAL